MKALWQIILQILWRLRPVQALEVNLRDVIDMGLAMFADDLALDDITHDPAYRSTLAAAFFDAHRKLDLLIYLRACEIAGVRAKITSFKPDYSHTSSSADLIKLWRSFHRLLVKFDDRERCAAKRAERLKREDTTIPPSLRDNPLRLDAPHRSTSPGFAGGELRGRCAFLVLHRQRRGRWIARSCAQDGGGCASSRGCLRTRGPPLTSLACRLPTASQLPARPPPHALIPERRHLLARRQQNPAPAPQLQLVVKIPALAPPAVNLAQYPVRPHFAQLFRRRMKVRRHRNRR